MLNFIKKLFKKKNNTIAKNNIKPKKYVVDESVPKNFDIINKNIPYTYRLNALESWRLDNFRNKHYKHNTSITFTPTGIGLAKTCTCENCNVTYNITDYTNW